MSATAILRGLHGLLRSRPRTRDNLVAYQDVCLRNLVQSAYANVPYYRRMFDQAGLLPRDIRGIRDLAKIPMTSRADLQPLAPGEICARGAPIGKLRTVQTSGSTGAPLTVRRTMAQERLLLAYRARAAGAFGLGPGTRRLVIDHLSPEVVSTAGNKRAYERLGILPRLLIDWRRPKDEILEAAAAFRPHVISGPPSILSWFAEELDEADRRSIPSLRLTITRGETLTPQMRRQIEEGFRLPLADVYGSHECVFIALQLPHSTAYRVCEEAVVVEILKGEEAAMPGESGEIVITALHSTTMPFLRYRLGDRVTLGLAGEGDTGPYMTLRSIDGRAIDRFLLPDGRQLHGYTLGEAVEASGLGVRRFRIVQEKREAFLVELVLYEEPPGQSLPRLKRRLGEILGPGVDVALREVQTLMPIGSRKFHTFVSVERLEALTRAKTG